MAQIARLVGKRGSVQEDEAADADAISRIAERHHKGGRASEPWGGSGYAGKLQPTERRKLGAYFEPHNRELYQLIGRDMGWEADNGRAIVEASAKVGL